MRSLAQLASRRPSLENARPVIAAVCPSQRRRRFPVCAFVNIQFAVAIVAIAGNRPERDPFQAVDLRARANRLGRDRGVIGQDRQIPHLAVAVAYHIESPPTAQGAIESPRRKIGDPTGPPGHILFEAACGEIH